MNSSLISVAFYNVENLFDIVDNEHTLDRDYTPKGKKKWGAFRYEIKIKKIGRAISRIGEENLQNPPTLIGLAEVENKRVLEDLISDESLERFSYKYIHFDSPDERGIDVALLYDSNSFVPLDSYIIPVIIFDSKNTRDYTRDILYVKGELNNEIVHLYINHWPSKRSGYDETRLKHIQIAKLIHNEIAKLGEENPKIIMMGDFNDNPIDDSIHNFLVTKNFQNPMLKIYNDGLGSSKFYGKWMLFDQIILSKNFFSENKNEYLFKEAFVFNAPFLTNPRGRHKNEPFRTYSGKYYQGGYSDHFPVYILLYYKS